MTEHTRLTLAPIANPTGLDDLLDELAEILQAGNPEATEAFLIAHPEHTDELRRRLPAMQALAGMDNPLVVDRESHLSERDLGDFRLIREVGRGGMGIVYEAEQISLNRRVALKVLPFAGNLDPRHLQRFRNEAQAAACLHHGNIVPIHGVGCDRGVHYYAMQLIEGQTLAQVIAEQNLSAPPLRRPTARTSETSPIAALTTKRDKSTFRHIAELIATAADALEYAHSMGVVHRDIKPGNVMLDNAGHLWITDFGLAKLANPAREGGGDMTLTGDLIGTLRYMSPEQALARHGLVDHRTDIYSLGATLYELLTLRPAVDSADKAEILKSIAWDEPTPLRKHDKSIPAELETITLKCLAKEPGERYATAGEMAEDLRRWLQHETIKAKQPGWRARAAKWARRHVAAVWAVAAVLFVLTIAAALSTAIIFREQRLTRDAYVEARLALDELSSQVIDDWLVKQPALTQEHRTFLERALAHYERFAAIVGRDAESRAGVAAACLRLGEIHQKLGQISLEETSFGRAIELYQQLVDADPESNKFRLALSMAQRAQGTVLQRRGQSAEAEACFQSAMALQRQLINGVPTEKQYRFELAGTLLNYGDLLRFSVPTLETKAPDLYEEGRGLMEVLAPDPNAAPAYRHRLAEFHFHIGLLHNEAGRATEAKASSREAISILEALVKSTGNGPAGARYRDDLANCLTEFARALARLKQVAEAVDIDRRSVEIRESLAGDFPSVPSYRHSLAMGLAGLASRLADVDQLSDADPYYQRACSNLQKLIAEHPDEVTYREALAEVLFLRVVQYFNRGRAAEIVPTLRDANAIWKQLLDRHPSTYLYRNALVKGQCIEAMAIADSGKLAESEAALRRIIEEYSNYATPYCNLGQVLHALDRLPEAEAAYIQAIHLELGGDQQLAAEQLQKLVREYSAAGRHSDSIRLCEKLRDDSFNRFGASHYNTLAMLNQLAISYRHAGRVAEAIKLYEESIVTAEQAFGRDDIRTLTYGLNLAMAYQDSQRLSDACRTFESVLRRAESALGPTNEQTLLTMSQFARYFLHCERYSDAEKMLRELLPRSEKKDPAAWNTFDRRSLLGAALVGQKKFTEAEPLLVQGYSGLKERTEKIPARIRTERLTEAADRLIKLYEETNKLDEVAKWKAEHARLQESLKANEANKK